MSRLAEYAASPGWFVRHWRESHPFDHVWYVGPYPTAESADDARTAAVRCRPIRLGPNGPIDSVAVVRCKPLVELIVSPEVAS